MKKSKKLLKKYRKYGKYAIIAGICIIIIIAIVIKVLPKGKIVDGVRIVEIEKTENEEITKEEALQISVKQFKYLGEKEKEDQLRVEKITQDGQEYFYIKSAQNSIQIQIKGGKIIRINNVII